MIVLLLLFANWVLILVAFSLIAGVWVGGLLSIILFSGVAIKTYYSCAMPQLTGLWLRKFHVEPKRGFRLSRVFEGLSISGVRMITLADSRVAVSSISRRQTFLKLGLDIIGFIIFPVFVSAFFFLAWLSVLIMPEKYSYNGTIPEWFESEKTPIVIVAFSVFYIGHGLYELVKNIMRIRVIGSGSVKLSGAAVSDFIVEENSRTSSGATSDFLSGMRILQVSDSDWKDVVAHAIRNVDLVFFDATKVSDQMLWELGEIKRSGSLNKTIFIRDRDEESSKVDELLTPTERDSVLGCLDYGAFKGKTSGESACRRAIHSTLSSGYLGELTSLFHR